jgi:hypothetical protein
MTERELAPGNERKANAEDEKNPPQHEEEKAREPTNPSISACSKLVTLKLSKMMEEYTRRKDKDTTVRDLAALQENGGTCPC